VPGQRIEDLEAPSWTDFLAQYARGSQRALRVPGQLAIGAAKGFAETIEEAKRQSTSAAMGGDYDPKAPMQLATGMMVGGTPFAVRGAVGSAGGKPFGMSSPRELLAQKNVKQYYEAFPYEKHADIKYALKGTEGTGFSPMPKKVDPELQAILDELKQMEAGTGKFALTPEEKAYWAWKEAQAKPKGELPFGTPADEAAFVKPHWKQYFDKEEQAQILKYLGKDPEKMPLTTAMETLKKAKRSELREQGWPLESLDWRGLTSPHATEFTRNIPVHAETQLGFNPHFPLFKGRTTGKSTVETSLKDPSKKDYERGLFFAEDPLVAHEYGAPVTQYVAAPRSPVQYQWTPPERLSRHRGSADVYTSERMDELIEAARGKGHDLIRVKDLSDIGASRQNQIVVVDPSIVRLPHARFDPEGYFRRYSNLLRGTAGGGATSLAVLESERERRD
jgi:hypothetical protein